MNTANNPSIESQLPIKEISVEAIREGGALAGHTPVNQLHVWWAWHPLVPSQAISGRSPTGRHRRVMRALELIYG